MPLPAGLLAEFDSASVNAASVTFQGTSRVADIALAELITNSSRGQVSVGQRTVANAIGFTADLHLADSALHAPQASFGEDDAYPDLVDKAAVLGWHLVKNHPLPDGNKRCALVAMVVFLKLNGIDWSTPTADEAVATMLAVAAGELDASELGAWLRARAV